VQFPAAGPFPAGDTFRAIVKVYGSDNHVTVGTARITPDSGWTPLSVDLSGWPEVNSVKRIQVWVQGSADESWVGSYDIGQVGFWAGLPPPVGANLDITATAAQHAVAVETGVTVSVTNDDAGTLTGNLSVGTCPAATVSPGTVSLAGLGTGQRRSFTGTLTSYTATADPVLCLAYDGETFTVPLVIPPPAPHTLYAFSDGTTDGWVAGQNVGAVTAVTGFPNGPGTPYESTYALNATGMGVAADAPKTVTLTPAAALDLAQADTFFAYVDCYGGAPGAAVYTATIQRQRVFLVVPGRHHRRVRVHGRYRVVHPVGRRLPAR
jgi:hypothetical protein